MTTSSPTLFVRRAATSAVTVLLVALLAPLGLSARATAESGEARPGVPRADASAVAAGGAHACGIVADGSLRCWGANLYGQLGQGNTGAVGTGSSATNTVAVDLGPGRTATAVAAGKSHTCAILDTGQLRCWGHNGYGQLAQGNSTGNNIDIGDQAGETTVAVDLGVGRTATAVAAGADHTCAILDTGQLRCWGRNNYGQLAQGDTTTVGDGSSASNTVAIDFGVGRNAVAVAAGYTHTCAILDTGQLRCWGNNNYGQLGQGTITSVGDGNSVTNTVAVDLGPGRTALAVTAGAAHTCAILDTGQLRCWGRNDIGQLGQGTTTNVGDTGHGTTAAVDLGPGRTATAVTAGAYHTCAILDTGLLRCWGTNGYGQLGQGTTTNVGDTGHGTTAAVDLGAGRTAVSTTGGDYFTCAVLDTRQLRCWGNNFDGQLGQGSALPYGKNPGETPAALPAINLGGQLIGRDTDRDGFRDAVDACPTVAGTLPNGCAVAVAVAPEAVLTGKKVLLDTVLTKKKASAKCPKKAEVTIRTKSKRGPVKVTKQLRTKTVTTGCLVKGSVKLPAKPKKTAKVEVTITGQELRTKRLVAVRP